MADLARRWPLLTFFALAYALAWAAWAPLVLSRAGLGLLPIDLGLPYIMPGTYAPLAAALITQRLTTGHWRIGTLLGPWQRLLAGIACGTALVIAAFLVLPAVWVFRGGVLDLAWAAVAFYPERIAVAAAQAGPVGEEPGWRGFALPRLQAVHHPVTAASILGVVWAAWHLPLFLVSGWAGLPFLTYVLLLVAVGFLVNFAFNVSHASIAVAIVTHAVFNASSAILGRVFTGAEMRTTASSSVVLVCSFVLVATVVALGTRGGLGRGRTA